MPRFPSTMVVVVIATLALLLASPADAYQRAPRIDCSASAATVLDATFAKGQGGFEYEDNAFRETRRSKYASGRYWKSNDALAVLLGGVDDKEVKKMSGGYAIKITPEVSGPMILTLRYKMSASGTQKKKEDGFLLASLNGELIGEKSRIHRITGKQIVRHRKKQKAAMGKKGLSTGWRTIKVTLDNMTAGKPHVLKIGGYMSLKLSKKSTYSILIRRVLIQPTACAGSTDKPEKPSTPVNLFLGDFEKGADQFFYTDDVFRDTSQPDYAMGKRWAEPGMGGVLAVELGGIDGKEITGGMSGGWSRQFNVQRKGGAEVSISLRFQLSTTGFVGPSEFGEALFSIDGKNILKRLAKVYGVRARAIQKEGPKTVKVGVGHLSDGIHTLTVGGYMNKKSAKNQGITILFDDIVATSYM